MYPENRNAVIVIGLVMVVAGLFAARGWPGSGRPGDEAAAIGAASGVATAQTPAGKGADAGNGAMAEAADASMPGEPAALASLRYRNVRELGTLSPADIAKTWQLDALPLKDGHVQMNHRTRLIVEDLVRALPREDITNGAALLERAVAETRGPQAAVEFSVLLRQFVKFSDSVAAIDAERNAQGLTVADPAADAALRRRLQDASFGAGKAAGLFRVEREAITLLASRAVMPDGTVVPVMPEEIARLHADEEAP